MLKNIIFDMGNVILRYDPPAMIKNFTSDPDEIRLFSRELFSNKEWIALDKGIISEKEALEGIHTRVPERLWELCDDIFLNWHRFFMPITETYEVVKTLKAQGFQLYTLTNAAARFRKYYMNVPAFTLMDGFVVSAEEKLLKPDLKIYTLLCERFSLKPKECFFIDDAPENVAAAKELGMKGHIFTGDTKKLLEEINDNK